MEIRSTFYYPKSRLFSPVLLLCLGNLAAPSQYIVLNLQFFKNSKEMPTAYANQRSTPPNQQLSETCLFFPKALPIPKKKYTFPLWVCLLIVLLPAINTM